MKFIPLLLMSVMTISCSEKAEFYKKAKAPESSESPAEGGSETITEVNPAESVEQIEARTPTLNMPVSPNAPIPAPTPVFVNPVKPVDEIEARTPILNVPATPNAPIPAPTPVFVNPVQPVYEIEARTPTLNVPANNAPIPTPTPVFVNPVKPIDEIEARTPTLNVPANNAPIPTPTPVFVNPVKPVDEIEARTPTLNVPSTNAPIPSPKPVFVNPVKPVDEIEARTPTLNVPASPNAPIPAPKPVAVNPNKPIEPIASKVPELPSTPVTALPPVKPITIPTPVKPTTETTVAKVSEMFIQAAAEKQKVDVLWVVDNSGSMQNEQQALGIYFKNFIENFIDEKDDFKMAITTTDGRPEFVGKMVPGSITKLNSDAAQANSAKFKADFNKMINVGIKGSGKEMGLAAVDAFIKNYGKTFLRKDAYLAVIIVSDEEDQSPNSPEFYIKNLKAIKANPGLVKVYSIVDTKLSNNGHSTLSTGYKRYGKASKATSGGVYDIQKDFDTILEGIGKNLKSLLHSFALSNDAQPATIKITVNGEVETRFSYDKTNRSVTFDDNAIPEANAKIKITYEAIK